MDRKSHLFCIVCSKDISEVTGGNNYIDLLSVLDLAVMYQCCISIYIIYDLRNKTSDIDRVCRRELESCLVKLCCHLMIIEHLLNCSLGIIKVACDSYNIGIGTLLSYHLLLLDRTYTMLRIKYDDLGSRHICKACHCSFTCISGSCSEDHDLILDVVLLRCCCHQMWKDGKCHIFKCDGSAVEQL